MIIEFFKINLRVSKNISYYFILNIIYELYKIFLKKLYYIFKKLYTLLNI